VVSPTSWPFVFVEIPPPPVPIENEAVWASRVDLNPGTSYRQGSYYTDYTFPAPLCTKYDCILACWREFYYTRRLHSESGTVILVVCPFCINTNLTCEFLMLLVLRFLQLKKLRTADFQQENPRSLNMG